jgi:peroxiredoxin
VPLRYSAPAPDFTLLASNGGEVTLSSYRGLADVVVVFYCYDWGGI